MAEFLSAIVLLFLHKIKYLKKCFLHLGWCLRGENGHFVFGKFLVLTYRNYLIRDTPTKFVSQSSHNSVQMTLVILIG